MPARTARVNRHLNIISVTNIIFLEAELSFVKDYIRPLQTKVSVTDE